MKLAIKIILVLLILGKSTNESFSNVLQVGLLQNLSVQNDTVNAVTVYSVIKEGIKVRPSELPIDQGVTSSQFFDGLGRLIQTVSKGTSPGGGDIVNHLTYDHLGRRTKEHLPYSTNSMTGTYQPAALDDQLNFYQNTSSVAIDVAPYAKRIYEPSPLNRVVEQGAVGTAWQPGEGATTQFSYDVNTVSDEVYMFEINSEADDLANAGFYPKGELTKTITTDEEDHQVIEFTDKQGQTILKRVQAHENGESEEWADTYYVYDDFGNLRFVLPPEAIKNIEEYLNN